MNILKRLNLPIQSDTILSLKEKCYQWKAFASSIICSGFSEKKESSKKLITVTECAAFGNSIDKFQKSSRSIFDDGLT